MSLIRTNKGHREERNNTLDSRLHGNDKYDKNAAR